RCHAGKQILDSAPQKPQGFGHLEMLPYGRLLRAVDVFSPGGCVFIMLVPEAWKQIELQVIVRIDESREDQEPSEIQGIVAAPGSGRKTNAPALNRQIGPQGIGSADGHSRAGKCYTLFQIPIHIAGALLSSANMRSLPAVRKISLSGSPNAASTCR